MNYEGLSNAKLFLEHGTSGFQVSHKAKVLTSNNLVRDFVRAVYVTNWCHFELLVSSDVDLHKIASNKYQSLT